MLQGKFRRVTIAELQARHCGAQSFIKEGLFAIVQGAASNEEPLPPKTPLLQIRAAGGRAHYLLANDTRTALGLVGERAHLFDLLCAHEKHEHGDRHLATHVALLERMEADADTAGSFGGGAGAMTYFRLRKLVYDVALRPPPPRRWMDAARSRARDAAALRTRHSKGGAHSYLLRSFLKLSGSFFKP